MPRFRLKCTRKYGKLSSFKRPRRARRRLKQRPTRKAPHQKRYGKAYHKRRVSRFRSTEPGLCFVRAGCITWILPRKLRSPNKLRGGLARYGDTKAWERIFEEAAIKETDNTLGPCSKQRLRLEVVRLAPYERFFLDRTNLAFSVKGLEDALVRLEFLVDDNEKWEDGPYVSQAVSGDGKYWTVVRLMVIKGEETA